MSPCTNPIWEEATRSVTVTCRHHFAPRKIRGSHPHANPFFSHVKPQDEVMRREASGTPDKKMLPALTLSTNKPAKMHMRNNVWKRQVKMLAFLYGIKARNPWDMG